jgi:Na+/H+-dicarboxylate symporter
VGLESRAVEEAVISRQGWESIARLYLYCLSLVAACLSLVSVIYQAVLCCAAYMLPISLTLKFIE